MLDKRGGILKHRINQHKYCKKSLIGKIIQKYGWENFKVEILEECEKTAQLNEREIFWIAFYNCKIPNGYNVSDGGSISRKVYCPIVCVDTNETFDNLVEASKYFNIPAGTIGKVCAGSQIDAHGLIFDYLDEQKKIKADIKRQQFKHQKKAVICVNTGIIYPSGAEAARATGIDARIISVICNKKFKNHTGLIFEFVDTDEREKVQIEVDKRNNKKNLRKKPVRCIDNGIIYESLAAATRATGIDIRDISRNCTGICTHIREFHFEFVDEELREKANLKQTQKKNLKKKPVICLESGEVFESAAEAAKHFGILTSGISTVCNKKQRSVGNLHFEFVK